MKHPQADNLIIAANDKDAFFKNEIYGIHHIDTVLTFSENSWTYVKPAYKYQHVKDAWEKDKSLVVQFKKEGVSDWGYTHTPNWKDGLEYRIKPKTITNRLYASKAGEVWFQNEPGDYFYIPIHGTDTEVEI